MPSEGAGLSRRRLLGLALGAGGLVMMGGLGSLLALRGHAPRVNGLRVLTHHEYRTFAALASVLVPDGGAFPEGSSTVDLARAFDGFLADEPEWNVKDLKNALFLLEFGPVLFSRRLTTFSHLSPPERLSQFSAWQEGDDDLRRAAAAALRKFTFLVFYDTPAVWPRLGYDGPLIRGGTP